MKRARNARTRAWRAWCRAARDPRVTTRALGLGRKAPAPEVEVIGYRPGRAMPEGRDRRDGGDAI